MGRGVDVEGAKVPVACVSIDGEVSGRILCTTDAPTGMRAVQAEIVEAVGGLLSEAPSPPVGMGVAVAGRIEGLQDGASARRASH